MSLDRMISSSHPVLISLLLLLVFLGELIASSSHLTNGVRTPAVVPSQCPPQVQTGVDDDLEPPEFPTHNSPGILRVFLGHQGRMSHGIDGKF